MVWTFHFSLFPNALIKPLENAHKSLIQTPKVEYIVLGSGHKSDENLIITSQNKRTAINKDLLRE